MRSKNSDSSNLFIFNSTIVCYSHVIFNATTTARLIKVRGLEKGYKGYSLHIHGYLSSQMCFTVFKTNEVFQGQLSEPAVRFSDLI